MDATILSIGNELLSGLTMNSNASFIGEKLTGAGVRVVRIDTVGDDIISIQKAMERAAQESNLVVTTGGLGATEDDLTRDAAARFLGTGLRFHSGYYARIERFFKERGLDVPFSNRRQAELPEGAQMITNPVGMAPGLKFRHRDTQFYLLPGVPKETRAMIERTLIPEIRQRSGGRIHFSQTFRTAGISESALQDRLGAFSESHPSVRLAYLPKQTGVVLRTSAFCESEEACRRRLRNAEQFIVRQAGDVIYSTSGEDIEEVVGRLLAEKDLTLSVAESCTGGLIGHLLTNVPGSSDYFDRGVVAYSNTAKQELLHVPPSILRKHGAVSAETAEAMARGIREISGTDVGLSVTGIAGPGGGRKNKPVGLVYIGYSDASRTLSEKHVFYKDRLLNKIRSAVAALDLLRRRLIFS